MMPHMKIIISVFVIVCFGNALLCGFVFDDMSAVRDNMDLRPNTPFCDLLFHDFWGTPLSKEHSHKSYRPITVFTFKLNYLIHELRPAGYHLVNVMLHTVNSVLYLKVLHVLRIEPDVNEIAVILFAVHPIHTEAVTGVVGRAECLCALFFLLAVMSFSRFLSFWRLIFVAFFAFAATFSKEQGVTVLGLWIVYEAMRQLKGGHHNLLACTLAHVKTGAFWKPTLAMLGIGSIIMACRVWALRGTLPVFTAFDNPAAAANFPSRQLTYFYLGALNTWLLICPDWLIADWTMGTVPLVQFMDVRNLATLFVLISFGVLILQTIMGPPNAHARSVIFALAWMILPYIPASNLLFPVGFVIAERVLYLPSMGFCLLIAVGYQRFAHHKPRLAKSLFVFTVLTFMIKTIVRNTDWRDDLTLFSSAAKATKNNAKVYNNIGHYFESLRQFDTALPYFLKAAEVQSNDLGAWMNVGRTYNALQLSDLAEQAFLKAKALLPHRGKTGGIHARVAPQHLNVFINLGNLYKNRSLFDLAASEYRQALSMKPDFIPAYQNLGDVLIEQGRYDEARSIFSDGLTYDASSADLWYNLGVLLLKTNGSRNDALMYFEEAVKRDSSHVQALLNSAILCHELARNASMKNLAMSKYRQVLSLTPSDPLTWLQLGTLQHESGDLTSALQSFSEALRYNSSMRSALTNLAIVQLDLKMVEKAFDTLQNLVRLHPTHVKGWLTLCDVYLDHKHDPHNAELCYKQVLALDEANFQARHNLCIVLINQKLLAEAKECVAHAEELGRRHPHYTMQHVGILVNRLRNL